VAADGSRLAKRAGGVSVRDCRAAGASPATIVTALARMLGLPPRSTPRELLAGFDRGVLAGRAEVRLPGRGDAVDLLAG
jgi:hypothetical protein